MLIISKETESQEEAIVDTVYLLCVYSKIIIHLSYACRRKKASGLLGAVAKRQKETKCQDEAAAHSI